MNLYKLYQKLYQLSQKQKQYIKKGNYDKLLQVLEKKREIMDQIDEIDTKTYIKLQNNPDQALNRLQKLVSKTKKLEDENQKILEKDKDDLATKMLDFNQKQKSRQGYNQKNGYEAKFIDKKS